MNRHAGVSVYGTTCFFDPAASCHRDANGTHAIRILARGEKAHNSGRHASDGHRRSPWRSLTGALALALVAAIGNAAVPDVSHAQTTPTFAKHAFDANTGLPLTGPPVSVGQTIEFVLSYKPGTTPTGPVTIDDTLSSTLAFVGPILAPPGWTWTLPPYSVGNHEVYSNSGFGPGTSFIVNVPVADLAQVAPPGGDGFYPIPVGNRVFSIWHHTPYFSATTLTTIRPNVMCWDLLTLIICPGYPKSLDSTTDPRATPQTVRTVVGPVISNKRRIYYPSARFDGTQTYYGIGCWEIDLVAGADAACPFIDLLPNNPSSPSVVGNAPFNYPPLTKIAGVVADPANPSRLFMYAVDRVYCVDVSVPNTPSTCMGWSQPSLQGNGSQQLDMIFGEGPSGRLYVHYGITGGTNTTVACLDASTGNLCWSTQATMSPGASRYGSLSPVLNTTGTAMIAVCLHPYVNNFSGAKMTCFDASSGSVVTATSNPSIPQSFVNALESINVITAFHIPTTGRVLYARYQDAPPASCFDFSSGALCSPFTPPWGPSIPPPKGFEDYGYAVDPAAPDRCLLGLGNQGKLWRFTREGGFDTNGCVKRVEQTFDINRFFPCAIKPKQVTWDSIVIRPPRPTQLTGGTINLVNSLGQTVKTLTVLAAPTNSYPINIPATGANSQLTLQFVPAYSPGLPTTGYQLELTFTADIDPYICYQAVVKDCGPVRNDATMVGSLVGRPPVPFKVNASVNLGNATGRICEPGILKVCKVAGPGIAIGETFHFTAISNAFTVPAGPPPGGTCVVVGQNYTVPSGVIVKELIPPGVTVSNITVAVAPPGQLVSTNLAGGSVNLLIGSGVTEVTFTDKRTGFLEICKSGEVKGNSKFTVNDLGPFDVPPGACSPAIEVPAGEVVIHETPPSGTAMAGCNTIPPSQQGPCDPKAQTSTVTVAAGNVSSMTIAFITNKYTKGGTEPAPTK